MRSSMIFCLDYFPNNKHLKMVGKVLGVAGR